MESYKKLGKEIAKQIIKYRNANNLNQEDLAKKIGVHKNTIFNYEKGKTFPNTEDLFKFANVFNISMATLLEGENPSKIRYPYISKISAKNPILARENIKNIMILENLFPKGTQYCLLKIKEESLKDCGINNNDFVLIDTNDIEPNEYGIYAVAIFENDIENIEAIVRRIKIHENTIALIPANPEYETRLYKKSDIRIIGKIIKVIKKF